MMGESLVTVGSGAGSRAVGVEYLFICPRA